MILFFVGAMLFAASIPLSVKATTPGYWRCGLIAAGLCVAGLVLIL